LKIRFETGERFGARQHGDSSILNLGVTPFDFLGPGVFDAGFDIETRDQFFNEAGALHSRQAKRFGFKFFNSGGHHFLLMLHLNGKRVP